jgi:hypothetical protein
VPLLVSGSEVAEVGGVQNNASEVLLWSFPSEASLSDILRDSDSEVGITHNANITYRWNCIKVDELSNMDGLTSGPHNNFQSMTLASSIGINRREALDFEAAVSSSCLVRHLSVSSFREVINLCDAFESRGVGKTPFVASSGHGPFSECEFSTEVETNHFHVAVIP